MPADRSSDGKHRHASLHLPDFQHLPILTNSYAKRRHRPNSRRQWEDLREELRRGNELLRASDAACWQSDTPASSQPHWRLVKDSCCPTKNWQLCRSRYCNAVKTIVDGIGHFGVAILWHSYFKQVNTSLIKV